MALSASDRLWSQLRRKSQAQVPFWERSVPSSSRRKQAMTTEEIREQRAKELTGGGYEPIKSGIRWRQELATARAKKKGVEPVSLMTGLTASETEETEQFQKEVLGRKLDEELIRKQAEMIKRKKGNEKIPLDEIEKRVREEVVTYSQEEMDRFRELMGVEPEADIGVGEALGIVAKNPIETAINVMRSVDDRMRVIKEVMNLGNVAANWINVFGTSKPPELSAVEGALSESEGALFGVISQLSRNEATITEAYKAFNDYRENVVRLEQSLGLLSVKASDWNINVESIDTKARVLSAKEDFNNIENEILRAAAEGRTLRF